MNANTIENNLATILDDAFYAEGRPIFTRATHPAGAPGKVEVKSVESFRQAGLLTSDAGLVLTLADGSQFQITIVQSR